MQIKSFYGGSPLVPVCLEGTPSAQTVREAFLQLSGKHHGMVQLCLQQELPQEILVVDAGEIWSKKKLWIENCKYLSEHKLTYLIN